MKHHGEKSHEIKTENPGNVHERLHPRVTHFGAVEGVDDPRVIDVIADVSEGHKARPALHRVEKIFGVRVGGEIRLSGCPDEEAVAGMIKNGKADEGDFHERDERQTLEKCDLAVIGRRPEEDEGIRKHVLEEKKPDGKNPRKRM